ncbi:MAG: lipoate protein ligase C-terminal domain-containing protein [Candidatus Thermoplasmatota archaeon]|nr:lipoate protein ligase C-terminal domain-containing protein [Candidatus Thermoplasmatota archaeon]
MELKSGILSASLKVEGGKLIRCSLEVKNSVILNAKITGDFFMHPEEKIEDLENLLRGLKLEEEKIRKALSDFYSGNVLVVGASTEDFVKLIMSAR